MFAVTGVPKGLMTSCQCFRASPRIVLRLTLLLGIFALWATAPAIANPKYAGLVVDVISGKTLYEANAEEPRYPASLTKIMTLYLVFEELQAGRLTLDTKLRVSEYAAARPPSKLGFRPGETIRVRDAIKALVTKSANDVATAIGENIEGSEAAFAARMTRTARRLGMSSTTYRNASGLPDPQQRTTARDMARLGIAIQRDFPQYYGVFQTRVFQYGKRRFGNYNRLLGRVEGVDGIKTGYIRASGFNLVTSVRRDGRQLVAVVMGGRTGASRNQHMKELIARNLPKATRGRPLVYAAWSDSGPPPVPGRKPVTALMVARLKQSAPEPEVDAIGGILAFAAETRAASTATPSAAGALQAVIAQATPAAAAPIPVPAPLAQADPADAAPPPAAGEPIRVAALEPAATQPAATGAAPRSAHELRIRTAFAVFDGAVPSPDLESLLAAIGDNAPAPGASTVEMGSTGASTPAPVAATGDRPAGWQIQVGAVTSPEQVAALQTKAESIVPALKARERVTSEVQTERGKLFRARFAGFPSRKAAQDACKRFAHYDRPCWAVSM